MAVSGPSVAAVGKCFGPFVIATQDGSSNAFPVQSTLAVSLSAAHGSYYPSSSCSGAIDALTLSLGTSSVSIYYSPGSSGGVILTAARSGVTSGTLSVSTLTAATKIATAMDTTCAIVSDGGVRCWGRDQGGTVGNNFAGMLDTSAPVQGSGLGGAATDIGVGDGFACAIVAGAVKCWGIATSGRLGNNNATTAQVMPVNVTGMGVNVTQIAVGNARAYVVCRKAVKCWGANTDGNLGDNTVTARAWPYRHRD